MGVTGRLRWRERPGPFCNWLGGVCPAAGRSSASASVKTVSSRDVSLVEMSPCTASTTLVTTASISLRTGRARRSSASGFRASANCVPSRLRRPSVAASLLSMEVTRSYWSSSRSSSRSNRVSSALTRPSVLASLTSAPASRVSALASRPSIADSWALNVDRPAVSPSRVADMPASRWPWVDICSAVRLALSCSAPACSRTSATVRSRPASRWRISSRTVAVARSTAAWSAVLRARSSRIRSAGLLMPAAAAGSSPMSPGPGPSARSVSWTALPSCSRGAASRASGGFMIASAAVAAGSGVVLAPPGATPSW
jgi:hypothetical protein